MPANSAQPNATRLVSFRDGWKLDADGGDILQSGASLRPYRDLDAIAATGERVRAYLC